MVEEQQETLHEEDYVYDEKVQLEDFNSPTGCHTVIIAPERASEAHDWCWLNVGFRWSEWTCGLIGDNRGTFKIINPSKAALFKLAWIMHVRSFCATGTLCYQGVSHQVKGPISTLLIRVY